MLQKKIVFYLLYPILFLTARLPLFVLYGFSNLLFYVVYYLIGYRKEVVRKNLQIAFPEKSNKERIAIEKESYRHLVDIFIEMLKGFGIGQKELSKRYVYTNPEIFKELEALNTSIILVGAHYGNWEWLFNINSKTKLTCYGAYSRIKNDYFEKFVKENRGRFGSVFIRTKDTIPMMVSNFRHKKNAIYGLLSDQSPKLHTTHYWAPFFNQVVPVHTGAEMLAKRFKFAVIYMYIKMPKRGFYEITFEQLPVDYENKEEYPLTDLYLQKTEAMIKENPALYFWTHDRFKHMGKQPTV